MMGSRIDHPGFIVRLIWGRSLMFTPSRCLRSTKDSGCGVKTVKFSIAKTALGVGKKKLGESNMTHMTQIEPD